MPCRKCPIPPAPPSRSSPSMRSSFWQCAHSATWGAHWGLPSAAAVGASIRRSADCVLGFTGFRVLGSLSASCVPSCAIHHLR
eukprot:114050-Prorocentrum_minimum.AAC.1